MNLKLHKYQGAGNDFILLDNREAKTNILSEKKIKELCDRHFGIGADGLMIMNAKDDYDFEMIYYNSDGRVGSMCGNGGRCITRFAYDSGIKKSSFKFFAVDGDHESTIDFEKKVSLKMIDVNQVDFLLNHYLLNTGSPHYVKFVPDVYNLDVVKEGSAIRFSKDFSENGVNVNFVQTISEDEIYVRTYERGVEDETLSCGTGVTASALVAAHNDNGFNAVCVRTKGGKLQVEFEKSGENNFTNIWLSGPAEFVFQTTIEINKDDV
ncbi:MAG: diaminopimelate epimerase [Bacteroidetes bacterium]|nr:diaminopimelate epimerase [Bacteroidota bacterium]